MYLNGGNLALTPERAKTWSASIAFHPEALPRLEMELTGFDIDYTDRIVLPITSTSDMLTNPIYDDFVTHRSEEHTSELQSLMRISYAVFCLKKKKKHIHTQYITRHIHMTNDKNTE